MFGDQDHAAWHDNERLMSVRFEGERWRDNCVNIPVMAQITPVIPLRSKDLSLGVAIAAARASTNTKRASNRQIDQSSSSAYGRSTRAEL
ncbi:hypothetical protein HBI70_028470 [Parastagonospora nodorum]|nr:hypothetical protein HBH52_115740 [Parastagonospora nodorum]KAH4941425.1 hypothetical protein HBI79_036860 [Parastagonospora nodorum]KAH5198245.1 hypothetical protein HBH76_031650 [Parastagonospora nodorum]KAH5232068.1 hypothetical protein HBI62_067230 [Parastagonospora nodorum]KAH5271998.1 hypothetical protein HBI71_052840 [Parastagonospora nodorum]